MSAIFINSFQHSVDRQRRVAVPREWRAELPDPAAFYLLPGPNQAVVMMPEDYFRAEIVDAIRKVSFANPEKSAALAVMGSVAQRCVCDKQGRIALTPMMMEHAGITDQAALVGAITTIQIKAPSTDDQSSAIDSALALFRTIQESGEL